MYFRGPKALIDMCRRSGRRSPDRSERRFERMGSCFPPWREVHPRLGISRRRVLPEQCMVRPSTRIVSNRCSGNVVA